MIVEVLEAKFFELKGKLQVGIITEEQFKAEVDKLRFQDSAGHWWMIGASSGKWYSYDGARWLPGTPPQEKLPIEVTQVAPSEPSPIVTPLTPVVIVVTEPAPIVSAPKPQATAPLKPTALPPQPEHVKPSSAFSNLKRIQLTRPAPLRRFPIPGWMLILGAAALAMISVAIFWVVIENFVPGKPITSFINNLTGVKPVAPIGASPTVVISTQSGGSSIQVPTLLLVGDQMVAQSQMDTAITQYQTAAALVTTSATPLTRWARALAFKGQMQDAVAKSQLAVQRAPTDAEAFAQFCRVLIWNGQPGDGIAACDKAMQIDPKNANASAFVTDAYLLARRMTDAQARAQLALQIAPSSAEAHRAQAWYLTMQSQKDAANAEWQQTIALEPSFYFRHFEYGEVLRVYFNDPTNALNEYRTAVSLYGAYPPAINRVGVTLLMLNKPQEAIPQFQRALTLDPGNVDNIAYLGLAFGMANQCAQAIPYFQQTLRLASENPIAQKGLSDCQAGKPPTLPVSPPPQIPLTPPVVAPKP